MRDNEGEGEGEGVGSARRRESRRSGGRGARPSPPLGGPTRNRTKFFEATGLALLRRDGFASLAPREQADLARVRVRVRVS